MASGCDTIEVIKLQDISPDEKPTGTLMMPQTENNFESPMLAPTPVPIPDCVTFIKQKGRYNLAKQYRLKNSLLAGVGYLELANARDFTANVWNEIPVPSYAVALMAVGGTLALSISLFAFKDAELSQRNILLLQQERRYL